MGRVRPREGRHLPKFIVIKIIASYYLLDIY
jgi:hypothetical protein